MKVEHRPQKERGEERRLRERPRERPLGARDQRGQGGEEVEARDEAEVGVEHPPRDGAERLDAQVDVAETCVGFDAHVDERLPRAQRVVDRGVPRGVVLRPVRPAQIDAVYLHHAIGEPQPLLDAVPRGKPHARDHHVGIDEDAGERMAVPLDRAQPRDERDDRAGERGRVDVPARWREARRHPRSGGAQRHETRNTTPTHRTRQPARSPGSLHETRGRVARGWRRRRGAGRRGRPTRQLERARRGARARPARIGERERALPPCRGAERPPQAAAQARLRRARRAASARSRRAAHGARRRGTRGRSERRRASCAPPIAPTRASRRDALHPRATFPRPCLRRWRQARRRMDLEPSRSFARRAEVHSHASRCGRPDRDRTAVRRRRRRADGGPSGPLRSRLRTRA